jgi:hypothetical protein
MKDKSWIAIVVVAAAVVLSLGSCCCLGALMRGGRAHPESGPPADAPRQIVQTELVPAQGATHDVLAAQAEERATNAAADLVRDEAAVREELDAIDALIRAHHQQDARARLEALAPRFEPILNASFTLRQDASEDARHAVTVAVDLRRIFTSRRAALDAPAEAPRPALDFDDHRIGLACWRMLAEAPPETPAQEERVMNRCARAQRVSRARADAAYNAWVTAGMPGMRTAP